MDARHLHDEVDKLQVRARALYSDAQQARTSADGLNAQGDQTAGRMETEKADRLEREAANLERQAEQMSLEADEKIKRAHDIERRQEQVRKEADSAIDSLEKEKRDLTGNATGLFG